MKYGITNDDLKNIVSTFQQFSKVDKAVIFGSRAKGNYRPGSDIDIAIYNSDISFNEFLDLKIKLDDLELMNAIDLVNFRTINNPDLIDHISKVGIIIYEKVEALSK